MGEGLNGNYKNNTRNNDIVRLSKSRDCVTRLEKTFSPLELLRIDSLWVLILKDCPESKASED